MQRDGVIKGQGQGRRRQLGARQQHSGTTNRSGSTPSHALEVKQLGAAAAVYMNAGQWGQPRGGGWRCCCRCCSGTGVARGVPSTHTHTPNPLQRPTSNSIPKPHARYETGSDAATVPTVAQAHVGLQAAHSLRTHRFLDEHIQEQRSIPVPPRETRARPLLRKPASDLNDTPTGPVPMNAKVRRRATCWWRTAPTDRPQRDPHQIPYPVTINRATATWHTWTATISLPLSL